MSNLAKLKSLIHDLDGTKDRLPQEMLDQLAKYNTTPSQAEDLIWEAPESISIQAFRTYKRKARELRAASVRSGDTAGDETHGSSDVVACDSKHETQDASMQPRDAPNVAALADVAPTQQDSEPELM